MFGEREREKWGELFVTPDDGLLSRDPAGSSISQGGGGSRASRQCAGSDGSATASGALACLRPCGYRGAQRGDGVSDAAPLCVQGATDDNIQIKQQL